jgi:predicted chitinase
MDARTLSEVMGNRLGLARYEQLTPAWNAALLQADCTTVDRVAMWCSQLGHESGGLQWMEEIADGSAYEWRSDLGNNQPGDGRRFKGRGPIQVTGRHNYTRCSEWAFSKGYVPTPTFFVDNPAALSDDTYGFIGPVWYWTVARNMNSFADRNDIEGATRAVNGGLNGLQDRITYWNRAKRLGDKLLPEGTMAGVTFTNSEGKTVDQAVYMHYTDKRLISIHEQLTGHKDGYPGWEQLGYRTLVDALAAIGAALGIEGFKDPKAAKVTHMTREEVVEKLEAKKAAE